GAAEDIPAACMTIAQLCARSRSASARRLLFSALLSLAVAGAPGTLDGGTIRLAGSILSSVRAADVLPTLLRCPARFAPVAHGITMARLRSLPGAGDVDDPVASEALRRVLNRLGALLQAADPAPLFKGLRIARDVDALMASHVEVVAAVTDAAGTDVGVATAEQVAQACEALSGLLASMDDDDDDGGDSDAALCAMCNLLAELLLVHRAAGTIDAITHDGTDAMYDLFLRGSAGLASRCSQALDVRVVARLLRGLDGAAGRAAQRPDEKKKADASRDSSGAAPPAPAADPPATIAGPAKIAAGKNFEVRWTGGNRDGDQIAILRPGKEPADAKIADSVATKDGNPATLTAPERGGTYELRYISARGAVLARQAIAVEPAAANVTAPAKGPAGGTVAVAWTGPGGNDDFVTVVKPGAPENAYSAYAYTRDGTPAQLRLPDEPGRYEIRYVTGRENVVLARTAIEVVPAAVTLDAPAEAPAGSTVEIRFTGPANPGDYVTIVKPGDGDAHYAEYHYAQNGSPARLPLRSAPGEYEIRYVTGQSSKVLARRKIVATPAKGITLDAPAEAPIGTEISIAWTGPRNDSDYVTITKPEAGPAAYTD
ncbi:MAG: hypothetical protein KIT16_14150, partial [Rhodospirillaceae bacterium]|nr:hypothetical protein [Rhodospirillaceae bacterium]